VKSPSVLLLLGLALAALVCGALWLRSSPGRGAARAPPSRAEPEDAVNADPALAGADGLASEGIDAGREAISPAPEADPAGRRVRTRVGTFPWYGRVVDGETGAPVAGATLQVEPPPDAPRRERAPPTLVSAADGRFPPLHPREGGPLPTLRHPAHASVRVPLTPGHETTGTECVIALPRGASLALQLLEDSGLGRAGCAVLVRAGSAGPAPGSAGDPLPLVEGITWLGVTDAAGWCELSGIAPGHALSLEWLEPPPRERGQRPRSWPGELVLAPGERRVLTWRLGSGGRITGRAQDADGRPLEGLEIRLGSDARMAGDFRSDETEDSVRTDRAGRFAFDGLLPATWWVGLAPGEKELACLPARVEIAEGETGADVTLVVHRGLAIRGRVVLPGGQPRQGCSLFAVHEESGFAVSARSGEEGRFVLAPLVAGDYRLEATPADHHRFAVGPAPVLARAGDEDVVVRLEVGGVVSGRVVDRLTGRPVRAVVDLLPRSLPGRGEAQRFETGKDGRFEFRHVPPGGHELTARTGRRALATRSGLAVERGQEVADVQLALEPAARVTFLLAGEVDGLVQVWRDGLPVLQEPVPAGRPHPCALPAGEVTLRLFGASRDPPVLFQDLALTLGALEEREIELGPLPAPPGGARLRR
jgi:hypothetical protein